MVFRLAAAALATAVLLGQQQPQFRGGVDSVAVYATVFDRANQVVRDLTRENFQIFDDGHRQELTVFQNTFQPISAVLMVDTSASMALTLDLAREAAEQFLVRLSPGDKVRVGSFSDSLQLSDTFTDDRDWLLRWLRTELHVGNPTRLWDGLNITLTALADMGGRKVVVLLTDGEDTRSAIAGRTVVERAKAEGVMVYAVQIRSRSRPGMEFDIIGPGRPSFSTVPTTVIPPSETLRELAEHTGGAYFLLGPKDDVNATFTEVAFELHYQYVLGFTPQRLDGKLHSIDIRPSDPGWTVRSRRFYVATKARTN
jgi:Ca-activated chloride channel family protein